MASLPPLMEVQDVLARPGFGEADPGEVEALLDDASALIRMVAEDDFLDGAGGVELPAAIVPVVVSMVRRGMDNPRGLSSEQLGDYAWQQPGGHSTIYYTKLEKRIIRRAAGKLGVRSVDVESPLPIPNEHWR